MDLVLSVEQQCPPGARCGRASWGPPACPGASQRGYCGSPAAAVSEGWLEDGSVDVSAGGGCARPDPGSDAGNSPAGSVLCPCAGRCLAACRGASQKGIQ